MKTTRIMAIAALIAATGLALHVGQAQQVGARRIDLQRHDLSVPGREVVQTIVELAPGTTAPRHTHPGEEIIYVLEGTWEYTVEGTAAGDPQGRRRPVHPGRNDPRGAERRHRPRRGARDVHRRKRQAAPHGGRVSAVAAFGCIDVRDQAILWGKGDHHDRTSTDDRPARNRGRGRSSPVPAHPGGQ